MVTLAHAGVLCLDEAAEFDRSVLDALRQPLESGTVTVSRAGFTTTLPARFQMVLASNPCPCGQFLGDGSDCTCTPHVRRRYFSRLSGPLLDRIDIRVSLEKPTLAELDPTLGDAEPTAPIAQRVQIARERAELRYKELPWNLNAHVPGPTLRKHFRLPRDSHSVLINGGEHLSARAFDRVLRLAWTIADLKGHDAPTPADVATALSFRDAQGAWLAAA
jgi:magnesium chelatase family protein